MKKFQFLLVSLLILPVQAQTEKELRPLNEFSFASFETICANEGNFLFSPMSAYSALGMLSHGADGETKAQLDSILFFNKKVGIEKVTTGIDQMLSRYLSDGKIVSANACWVDDFKLKKDYQKAVGFDFVQSVDMSNPKEVASEVNRWANRKTEGRIPNILSPSQITPYTRMILCNSLYMNLPWTHKFEATSTFNKDFYDEDGDTAKLKFVNDFGYYPYSYDKKFHFVLKDLANEEQAFCLILPKEGVTLDEVEAELSAKRLSKLYSNIYRQRMSLQIPKFSVEDDVDFKEVLKSQGVNKIFELDADFSRMTDHDTVWVEGINQKSTIDFNEKRIVAAAVTIIRMGEGSSAGGYINPDKPIDVHADRPFLFLVIDKPTGGIFFMGRYEKPTQADIEKALTEYDVIDRY